MIKSKTKPTVEKIALPDWVKNKQAHPCDVEKFSSGDFLRLNIPRNEPILGKWFLKQSLSMIYGPRGCGKTYLALEIAHAIATAGSILGWQARVSRKVLYLDGEMAAPSLQQRLRKIVKSRGGVEHKLKLQIATPDLQKGFLPDLSSKEGQQMIDYAIEVDTEVVIVDNLSSWSKSGREDAETWAPIAEWALKHRSQGRAIIFIHHCGKAGTQRGTSRREDLLDTVIALKRPPHSKPSDGANFEVHFEKARNLTGTDVEPFFVKLTEDENKHLVWQCAQQPAQSDCRKIEASKLEKAGDSRTEIAKKLGVNKSTITRWLDEV